MENNKPTSKQFDDLIEELERSVPRKKVENLIIDIAACAKQYNLSLVRAYCILKNHLNIK